MAGGVSKEALRTILVQAMCAAKSVRVQRDHLVHLRGRLQERIHGDDDAAVVQEIAGGLFKVYFRGLEYASRYLRIVFQVAAEKGVPIHLEPAFVVIPDEQLYDVLLAQRFPARLTCQAQAFARIEAALHALKLAEEHHIPRCIELLVGVRPPTVTDEPLMFSGMTGYSDDPVTAAREHLAKNGFPTPATAAAASAADTGEPPQTASSVDLDHALTYLYRGCSLVNLAIKHIDRAVAVFSSFFDPKELADTAETADKWCFIPEVLHYWLCPWIKDIMYSSGSPCSGMNESINLNIQFTTLQTISIEVTTSTDD